MNSEPQPPAARPGNPDPGNPAPAATDPPPAGSGNQPPPAAPPPTRPRWSVRRAVVAVAIALVVAAGGGVAGYAVSESVADERGPGGWGGVAVVPGGGGRVFDGPVADLRHGEFQYGEVTALDDDSITARSADGHERTYVLDDDTRMSDGIGTGDDVVVVASTEGDTATAVTVLEEGVRPPRPRGPGGGPPWRYGD